MTARPGSKRNSGKPSSYGERGKGKLFADCGENRGSSGDYNRFGELGARSSGFIQILAGTAVRIPSSYSYWSSSEIEVPISERLSDRSIELSSCAVYCGVVGGLATDVSKFGPTLSPHKNRVTQIAAGGRKQLRHSSLWISSSVAILFVSLLSARLLVHRPR